MKVISEFRVGSFAFQICDKGYLFAIESETASSAIPVAGLLTDRRVKMVKSLLMSYAKDEQREDVARGCAMAMPFVLSGEVEWTQ